MAVRVDVKVPGLDRLRAQLIDNPQLAERVAKAWATIYRSFTRLRFVKLSRSGGEWPALKPATIKRRRGGGKNAAILRDTGLLFASLNPSLGQGGILKQTTLRPLGFRGELVSHQTYKSGPTLSEVASYHHHGDGNLPARTILVTPDQATIDNMGEHAKRIIVKAAAER